jgi:glycosyltransferase involved in cell wall biosynthesis
MLTRQAMVTPPGSDRPAPIIHRSNLRGARMGFHIVMGKKTDLAGFAKAAAADRSPRHMMHELANHLSAQVHAPGVDHSPAVSDRLRAQLIGTPGQWALARDLAAQLGPDDVLFATGEDVGIPLAALAARRAEAPRVAIYAHNLVRPRARAALRLFGAARRVARWFVLSQVQVDLLLRLGVPPPRICLLAEQTDTAFFTPGPAEKRPRPLIASVGLEQRDYRTLAAATFDLPVDVAISGSSPDAQAMGRAFPTPLPGNMTRRFYGWPELRQLYRTADIVVVPLFPNTYAAGVTTLLEAGACARPLIVTRTAGLADYLTPESSRSVLPGDPAALRSVITELLADDGARARLGQAAYEQIQTRHTPAHWLDTISRHLRQL